MKILISVSAAKKLTYVHLDPNEENSNIIRLIKVALLSAKVKGKIALSKVKGTTSIMLEKTPTSLQYTKFIDTLKSMNVEVQLVLKTKPNSKQSYYEVRVPVKVEKVVRSAKEEEAIIVRKASSKITPESKDLNNRLNSKSKALVKVFGYWRTDPLKELSKLPFPVAVDVQGYNKTTFMEALKIFMSKCDVKENKGSSPNRWTGKPNGHREYKHPSGWSMPEGAIFYLSRGVPPTQEFYKIVTGKTNLRLPSQKSYIVK